MREEETHRQTDRQMVKVIQLFIRTLGQQKGNIICGHNNIEININIQTDRTRTQHIQKWQLLPFNTHFTHIHSHTHIHIHSDNRKL